MSRMPIIGQAINCAVLAHGRNSNAVAQGYILESEAGKQCGHETLLSITEWHGRNVMDCRGGDGWALTICQRSGS